MYDVVIVGAGSAGSVLAGRLSEDRDRQVLLLEAGPAPRTLEGFPPEIRSVSDRSSYAVDHPNNWAFPAELLPGRPWHVPRGRILGGSSAINGGYFIRGVPNDYDAWGPGWSYADVLACFRRLEHDVDMGGPLHGDSGPTPVRRAAGALLSPLSTAFIEACLDMGFAHEPDKNAGGPPGVGLVPGNVDDGLRVNAAISHVLPHLDRPNLEVRGGVLVRRVLWDGMRACGVEIEGSAGSVERVPAGEVVLSAGAVNSAHLLLLSGVGPAEELRAAGIDVVADRGGVGTSWSDDPNVFVHYRPGRDAGSDPRMLVPQAALNYDQGDDPDGDGELLLFAGPLRPGSLSLMYGLHQEHARGRMSLASADPRTPPRISYHYLSDARDVRRAREGVRLVVEVLRHRAYRPWCAEIEDLTDDVLADDAALDAWIRGNLSTTVHAQGTAPMGMADDPRAVVDHRLRVHGVEGLRVADTSIIPAPLHRGPSATAMVIGERAAQLF